MTKRLRDRGDSIDKKRQKRLSDACGDGGFKLFVIDGSSGTSLFEALPDDVFINCIFPHVRLMENRILERISKRIYNVVNYCSHKYGNRHNYYYKSWADYASNGYLSIIKWEYKESGLPGDIGHIIANLAAMNGHVEVIKWCDNKHFLTRWTLESALLYSQLDVLKHLTRCGLQLKETDLQRISHQGRTLDQNVSKWILLNGGFKRLLGSPVCFSYRPIRDFFFGTAAQGKVPDWYMEYLEQQPDNYKVPDWYMEQLEQFSDNY